MLWIQMRTVLARDILPGANKYQRNYSSANKYQKKLPGANKYQRNIFSKQISKKYAWCKQTSKKLFQCKEISNKFAWCKQTSKKYFWCKKNIKAQKNIPGFLQRNICAWKCENIYFVCSKQMFVFKQISIAKNIGGNVLTTSLSSSSSSRGLPFSSSSSSSWSKTLAAEDWVVSPCSVLHPIQDAAPRKVLLILFD